MGGTSGTGAGMFGGGKPTMPQGGISQGMPQMGGGSPIFGSMSPVANAFMNNQGYGGGYGGAGDVQVPTITAPQTPNIQMPTLQAQPLQTAMAQPNANQTAWQSYAGGSQGGTGSGPMSAGKAAQIRKWLAENPGADIPQNVKYVADNTFRRYTSR
jgi:hypothetical protein